MKFTIHVSVNAKKEIKDELLEVIAKHLDKKGYRFDVGYDPRELYPQLKYFWERT